MFDSAIAGSGLALESGRYGQLEGFHERRSKCRGAGCGHDLIAYPAARRLARATVLDKEDRGLILKVRSFMKRQYSYQITLVPEEEGGYTVLVPSLPGCVSFGRTVEEATAHAKEAIALHLENLKAHGIAPPEEARRPVLSTIVNVSL